LNKESPSSLVVGLSLAASTILDLIALKVRLVLYKLYERLREEGGER